MVCVGIWEKTMAVHCSWMWLKQSSEGFLRWVYIKRSPDSILLANCILGIFLSVASIVLFKLTCDTKVRCYRTCCPCTLQDKNSKWSLKIHNFQRSNVQHYQGNNSLDRLQLCWLQLWIFGHSCGAWVLLRSLLFCLVINGCKLFLL